MKAVVWDFSGKRAAKEYPGPPVWGWAMKYQVGIAGWIFQRRPFQLPRKISKEGD
jgi:hypothetical protein